MFWICILKDLGNRLNNELFVIWLYEFKEKYVRMVILSDSYEFIGMDFFFVRNVSIVFRKGSY